MRRHLGRATALGVAARRRKAGNLPLLRTLQDLGVATSLELCLDAADYASYTGTGQTWADTSGSGCDFYRGIDGTASATDPTFNGTAGGLSGSEYWSFDGGDCFSLVGSNPSWVNGFHQASTTFTLAGWIYMPSMATNQNFVATTAQGNPYTGLLLQMSTAGSLRPLIGNGAAMSQITWMPDFVTSKWQFWALSMDEAGGAGASLMQRDGVVKTFDGAYSSPSASAADFVMRIGTSAGSIFQQFESGTRLPSVLGWSRALTAAELSDIYTKTRTRFGV